MSLWTLYTPIPSKMHQLKGGEKYIELMENPGSENPFVLLFVGLDLLKNPPKKKQKAFE